MPKNKSGPKYRVPFRRRREGKTNYHRRLRLIISHRNRLVVRASSQHVTVMVVKSLVDGDQMLAQSHSSQLLKEYSWVYHSGNLPSAYLTGYLCGMRAKKAGIEDAILDVGILVHDNRVKAAFKGFVDAGVAIPHDDAWFSEHMETRMKGEHIQNYAKVLSKDDAKRYKKHFAATLKRKGDPTKIVDEWEKVKDIIANKV